MTGTIWFDADMCAAFGAILYRFGNNANTIRLIHIPPDVEKILSKNGFLSNYGRKRIPDTWGSIIPYRRFDVKDDRYFGGYIEAELVHRTEMPRMSSGLLKKFRESVFEIFSNAVIHSQTRLGIFRCGQYFPTRHRLDFSVADLGIGIRRNVKENVGLDLAAEQAIVWATEGRNTTKRGAIPGGLVLPQINSDGALAWVSFCLKGVLEGWSIGVLGPHPSVTPALQSSSRALPIKTSWEEH